MKYSYKDYSSEENCDSWKFNMYQLAFPPPKIYSSNDYVIEYKRTYKTEFLQLYLHFIEAKLNRMTHDYCIKYKLSYRFQDVKQVIVQSLLELLPNYRPDMGTTLKQYAALHIQDKVRNFIHENGSMYRLGNSPNEYRALRKVNAIYYNLDLTDDEKIKEVEKQTGINREKIVEFLHQGADFRQFISLDQVAFTTDEDEQILLSEIVPDSSCDPQILFPKLEFKEKFYDVLNQLADEERYLFIETNSLCMDCFNQLPPHKRKTYQDISAEFFLHSESAVAQRIRKIEKFLQRELIKEKVVQACVIRFIGEEQTEGITRFKYAYRSILKSGEGLIDNLYDAKTDTFSGADVLKFAEGENIDNHPVANFSIRIISNRRNIKNEDTVFVEKLW